MGWKTTDDWDEVTCGTCKRNRKAIDAKNRMAAFDLEAKARAGRPKTVTIDRTVLDTLLEARRRRQDR